MLGISTNPSIHVSCYLYIIHRNMVEQIGQPDVACITVVNRYPPLQCCLPSPCMLDESNI